MRKSLELFNNIDDVCKNAKVNFYSVLFRRKKVKENFSIALPGNVPKEFFDNVCACIRDFADYDALEYNPLESQEIGYECLYEESLNEQIDYFVNLNSEAKDMNNENISDLSKANMLICEMIYNNKTYYLFMNEIPSDTILKGKTGFMVGEGKITTITNKKGFFLSFIIGFIWEFGCDNENPMLYIFDKKYFTKIFDYEEHLKKIVKEKSNIIRDLPFLSNSEKLLEKISQKNVYRSFSKIINDKAYIEAMKNTPAKTLKDRLLQKSSTEFTQDDFDENNELIVTESSYKKIVKMICKGFKYNFFQDRAE